jgi:chemotaxis protein methyltransferase CheR
LIASAMTDAECVAFLQWALPHLHMRWAGFRKVRRTVCKRLARRLAELDIPDLTSYRKHLTDHASEWAELDGICPITISRFYRDRAIFDFIGAVVLPALVRSAEARGAQQVRAWSVGCASGEEPYTLALMWRIAIHPSPRCALRILGTDVGAAVLARARRACYSAGSVGLLPPAWLTNAFTRSDSECCLREEFRADVEFIQQDVRETLPDGPFELILCRNLVFTYFDESLQEALLSRLLDRLAPDGALVIGHRENLPAGARGLRPWPDGQMPGIFRRTMQP